MNFETSKYLGAVGALLLFVGVYNSSVMSLIGLILVLIGLKGLADYYKESGIFSNFLYGVIVGIIGIIVAVACAFYLILPTLLTTIFPGWTFGNWTSLMSMTSMTPQIPTTDQIASIAGSIIAVLVILFVFFVITAFLMRRSLNELSKKSSVGLFATTGTILLVGAILTIIGIGFILIWIAMIILAVAFFTLKPLPPQASAGATTQPPTSV